MDGRMPGMRGDKMICKDCEYFHTRKDSVFIAFCGNWKNPRGLIKTVIRKCNYYKKKEAISTNDKIRTTTNI